ncbi:uncharacterized protein V6R79_020640 [Siganus canaliculatus]
MSDYINEQPRHEQETTGNVHPTEKRLCLLLFLTFGILCIIQATLNVTLRLTLYSGKESTCLCNSTYFEGQNQDKMEPDCEQRTNNQCNRLQERVNALTRDKNRLKNMNNDLTNRIKNLEEEKDRLKITMREQINKESMCLSCAKTNFGDQNCEQGSVVDCNRLQERFNTLTREKNLLENRNNELTNMIRHLRDEKDRLKMKLRETGMSPPQAAPLLVPAKEEGSEEADVEH